MQRPAPSPGAATGCSITAGARSDARPAKLPLLPQQVAAPLKPHEPVAATDGTASVYRTLAATKGSNGMVVLGGGSGRRGGLTGASLTMASRAACEARSVAIALASLKLGG